MNGQKSTVRLMVDPHSPSGKKWQDTVRYATIQTRSAYKREDSTVLKVENFTKKKHFNRKSLSIFILYLNFHKIMFEFSAA